MRMCTHRSRHHSRPHYSLLRAALHSHCHSDHMHTGAPPCVTTGMVPMMIYGRWGTPVPIPAPMTVVFGRPLGLPQHDDPPEELVQHYLDAFIAAMRDMFEKNKAAAGYPNYQFVVL